MKINRKKNTKFGILFGYVQKLLSLLFPFVIRTIIINTIGIQYLGLDSLFSSILNIMSLAELGLGTAMAYSMYKPIAKDDTQTINALLNVYKKVYLVIGLIVLTVGLLITPALPFLIRGTHPAGINLYLLYFIYLVNNVIGYLFFAYKASLFAAHQRNDISSKINISFQLLMYIAQIIVLFLCKNYYVYIIFLPLSTLGINLFTAYKTKKMYPQYFCQGKLNASTKSDLKKRITALATHKIGSVIQGSIDNICISIFLGLTLLGQYNNYMYIIVAVESFINVIRQSMVAGIGNSTIIENHDYNKKQFYKHLTIFSWISIWCTTCLMCLFQPFMKVWMIGKEENILPLSIVLCLVIMFYFGALRGTTTLYKDAIGMWWEDRFKPIATTIFNLTGTVICAYFGSFEGIILCTAFSYILVGFPWETIIFFKGFMKEKPTKYLTKQLLYLITCVVCVGVTYLICNNLPTLPIGGETTQAIIKVVENFIICAIVPNVLLFTIFCLTNQINRQSLKKRVKKIMKTIYYKLPVIPQNTTIAQLNRCYRIYRRLEKKYAKSINHTIKAADETSNFVFTAWLQGEENAPQLVKVCLKSIKEHFKDKEVVVITEQNFKNYVQIPKHITDKWQKGLISPTHFSDILRVALLAEHGGIWLDATVLCTGNLDKYINHNTELFVFSNEHRSDQAIALSSWLIYAKPNNPIIVNTRDLLYQYWQKNKKLVHYFLFHMLFTICTKELPAEWEKVPFYSNIDPHIILFYEFHKKYNSQRFAAIKKMSNFHKLTYKFDDGKKFDDDSFYHHLIKEQL